MIGLRQDITGKKPQIEFSRWCGLRKHQNTLRRRLDFHVIKRGNHPCDGKLSVALGSLDPAVADILHRERRPIMKEDVLLEGDFQTRVVVTNPSARSNLPADQLLIGRIAERRIKYGFEDRLTGRKGHRRRIPALHVSGKSDAECFRCLRSRLSSPDRSERKPKEHRAEVALGEAGMSGHGDFSLNRCATRPALGLPKQYTVYLYGQALKISSDILYRMKNDIARPGQGPLRKWPDDLLHPTEAVE